ncbi:MAG: hypothetical protein CMJ90_14835 [Planctomycetes bacterium]|nr:hypothetical protein [Planctomycetota bacterium]
MEAHDDQVLRAKYHEYQRMYSTDPEDRIWAAVAEAFGMAGDGPHMMAALERAVMVNPEWGKHHLDLAKARLQAHQWMSAAEALERCADLDASGCRGDFFAESFLYYLGYAMFGSLRYKEAAEAWRAADHVIQFWGNPEPLKDFHLHRAWAYHLEGDYLDAVECYRRALIAPGPGDTSMDDDMDPDLVEKCQDQMNDNIERYHDMAAAGVPLESDGLIATPYTS